MNRIRKEMRRFQVLGGMAAIVLGAVLLAFPMVATAQPDYSDYDGSESCMGCHPENYNFWKVSALLKIQRFSGCSIRLHPTIISDI